MEIVKQILENTISEIINIKHDAETNTKISTDASKHALEIVLSRAIYCSEHKVARSICSEILEGVFSLVLEEEYKVNDHSNEEACINNKKGNFRELAFESESESEDETNDDKAGHYYKSQLFFHEFETAARIKGLVHCISNDQELYKIVEQMCIDHNLCDYDKLRLINDVNYSEIFRQCTASYTHVYQHLRTTVCEKLTSQLKSLRDKLQNFITIQGNNDPKLINALTNIENLLVLPTKEREDKFEENNYSTTSWLESAESVIKRIRLSLTAVLSSSDTEDEEDEDKMEDTGCSPMYEEPTRESETNKPDSTKEEIISEFKFEKIELEDSGPSTSNSVRTSIPVAGIGVDSSAIDSKINSIKSLEPIKCKFAYFRNYRHEFDCTYNINHWSNILPPEKYRIFTSIQEVDEENSIRIKLFVHCKYVNNYNWQKTTVVFCPSEKKPEYVEIYFPNSTFMITAQLPTGAQALQPILRKQMNFVLSQERLIKVSQEYDKYSYNVTLCRIWNSKLKFWERNKSNMKDLGSEWALYKISKNYRYWRVKELTEKAMDSLPTNIQPRHSKTIKDALTGMEKTIFLNHFKNIQPDDATGAALCYYKYDIDMNRAKDDLIHTIFLQDTNYRTLMAKFVKDLIICPFQSCNSSIVGRSGRLHLYEKHMKKDVNEFIQDKVTLSLDQYVSGIGIYELLVKKYLTANPSHSYIGKTLISFNKNTDLPEGNLFCPFSQDSVCKNKSLNSIHQLSEHIELFHLKTAIDDEVDFLQVQKGLFSFECPYELCGYIELNRRNLIQHCSDVHRVLQRQLQKKSEEEGINLDHVKEKGLFGQFYTDCLIEETNCRICKVVILKKCEAKHIVFKHRLSEAQKYIEKAQNANYLALPHLISKDSCPFGCDTFGERQNNRLWLVDHALKVHDLLTLMDEQIEAMRTHTSNHPLLTAMLDNDPFPKDRMETATNSLTENDRESISAIFQAPLPKQACNSILENVEPSLVASSNVELQAGKKSKPSKEFFKKLALETIIKEPPVRQNKNTVIQYSHKQSNLVRMIDTTGKQIDHQSNTLSCPVSTVCKKQFSLFSKNDVLTISEHANRHFQNIIYSKQSKILKEIYQLKGQNCERYCCVPYCKADIEDTSLLPFETRFHAHYQKCHRFEAFVIFVSEKSIFETIKTYLPEEILSLVMEVAEHLRNKSKDNVNNVKSQKNINLASKEKAIISIPDFNPRHDLIKKYSEVKKQTHEKGAISVQALEMVVRDLLLERRTKEEAQQKILMLNSSLPDQNINNNSMIINLWEVYDICMTYIKYCPNVENCSTGYVVLQMQKLHESGQTDKLHRFLYFADLLHKPFDDGTRLKDKRRIKEFLLSVGDKEKKPNSKEAIVIDITDDIVYTKEQGAPLNNKLCCQSCKISDFESVEKLEEHLVKSSGQNHIIGCQPCKIRFSVRSGSGEDKISLSQLSLHVLTKGHIFNIVNTDTNWPLAASEGRPSCEACWMGIRFTGDREGHVKEKTHLENAKLLEKYVEYCCVICVPPITVGDTSTMPLTIKQLLFIIEVLSFQYNTIPNIRERVIALLANYYTHMIVPNSGGERRDSFLLSVKTYSRESQATHSGSIIPSFACYPCMRVFYTGALLESHLHTAHTGLCQVLCLHCEKLFDKGDLELHKTHKKISVGEIPSIPVKINETKLNESPAEVEDDIIILDDASIQSKENERQLMTVEDHINSDKKILQSRVHIEHNLYRRASKAFHSSKIATPCLDYKCDQCESEFLSPFDLSKHCSSKHLKTDNSQDTGKDFFLKSESESEFKVNRSFQTFDDIFNITREDKGELRISMDSVSNSGSMKRKSEADAEDGSEDVMKKKTRITREESSDIEKVKTSKAISEYYYFCLDCETHTGDVNECDHTSHPRVPIGIDIAGHYTTTRHTNLQPIREVYRQNRLLAVNNISYSRVWGTRTRKSWKKLVMAGKNIKHANAKQSLIIEFAGEITSDKYQRQRPCLQCGKIVSNAIDMYSHIKSHLP